VNIRPVPRIAGALLTPAPHVDIRWPLPVWAMSQRDKFGLPLSDAPKLLQ
jgi:hypothetical protein